MPETVSLSDFLGVLVSHPPVGVNWASSGHATGVALQGFATIGPHPLTGVPGYDLYFDHSLTNFIAVETASGDVAGWLSGPTAHVNPAHGGRNIGPELIIERYKRNPWPATTTQSVTPLGEQALRAAHEIAVRRARANGSYVHLSSAALYIP